MPEHKQECSKHVSQD